MAAAVALAPPVATLSVLDLLVLLLLEPAVVRKLVLCPGGAGRVWRGCWLVDCCSDEVVREAAEAARKLVPVDESSVSPCEAACPLRVGEAKADAVVDVVEVLG